MILSLMAIVFLYWVCVVCGSTWLRQDFARPLLPIILVSLRSTKMISGGFKSNGGDDGGVRRDQKPTTEHVSDSDWSKATI